MEEQPQKTHRRLIFWLFLVLIFSALIIGGWLFLTKPQPLTIKGTLKTNEGPIAEGTYDFRLKFYDATTRTDLLKSYDAHDITVDKNGGFTIDVPHTTKPTVATLMQVCIASSQGATPGTVTGAKGGTTLPSCEVPHNSSSNVAYNQTICGVTSVDATNQNNLLTPSKTVYATPTKACGQEGANAATISQQDIVTPVLNAPDSLSSLLAGTTYQPGTVLAVQTNGQVAAVPPTEAVGQAVEQAIANNPPPKQVTNVFNSYPTQGESQTLTLSGNVLSISGGNSVTLPTGVSDQDSIIGNELTDITPGGGLMRVGAGTTLDPFKVGLITCANGEVIKSSGSGTWDCAADNDTNTMYTAGTGLSLSGNTFSNIGVLSFALPSGGGLTNTGNGQNIALRLQNCANNEILQFSGGSWTCAPLAGASAYSFSITDNTTTKSVNNGDTITFIGNEGLMATVASSGTVTYGLSDNGVTTVKLADGSITTPKIANNAVTTLTLADGAVTNAKLTNSSLSVTAGDGLSGGGVVALGSSTTLNLQACSSGQILKNNGTNWACAADNSDTNTDNQTLSVTAHAPDGANTVAYDLSISGGNTVNFNDRDTLYSAATSGGLALNGQAFSLQTCPVGQLLKSTNATTPTYACAADIDTDTNTTYSAGTGLSLSGTTFNNTGVLSVAGSGALTSTGGQNPTIAFANGSSVGQFWQWNGSAWALATLPAEQDAIVGNEVTNVTGSNSGLVRSGTGTAVDPYTLAVSVGNGLQITGGNVAINSPTCSGTTKLQWTGSAFTCSTDVDTDTTNFVIGDGTTTQSISAGQAITFNGSTATKLNVSLSGTRTLNFALDTTGASSGQVLTYNGSALVWQTPATYAPTTCGVSGSYFCQNGNSFGGTATLGTSDNQSLVFKTNNTTAMTITNSGSVAIGSQTPASTLHVDGGTGNTSILKLTNGSTTGQTVTDGMDVGIDGTGVAYINQYEAQALVFVVGGVGSSFQRITVLANGNVGIGNPTPTRLLHVGSSSTATGAVATFQNSGGTCTVTPNVAGGVSCSSDERLKKNFENFSGALNLVNKIDIKKYNMNTDPAGAPKQIGVVAQELEKVLPGLVSTDQNGYKTVSYSALAPIALEAIKEQQIQINAITQGLWTGGVVTKDATFKSLAIFNGPARFTGDATFSGDVSILGNIKLSGDQVNQAFLPKGKRSATITFTGKYPQKPYITITPREFITGPYRVTNVTPTGFVIELKQPQHTDTHFDWHAFAKSG